MAKTKTESKTTAKTEAPAEIPGAPKVKFTEIRDALQPIVDPEIKVGILDLGLVYGAKIEAGEKPSDGDNVRVQVTLTSPACPYGPMLLAQIHGALAKIKNVRDVDVDLVWVPTWDPREMASEEAKDMLGIF
jgi:metal-sulfur cluster biosynthetic enzyme